MRAPKYTCIDGLVSAGIAYQDAQALRRIAMTLHRWFELECGDGNSYGSWAIERDDNGDGPPFLVHHHYNHGHGKDYTTRSRIPDKEAGAKKRLGVIMSRYPSLRTYIQREVAIGTLKMSDAGALVMSGMSKEYARNFLRSIGWKEMEISRLEIAQK